MRVTRTVRDFQNALLTLLEEYSFEHLTVDQIIIIWIIIFFIDYFRARQSKTPLFCISEETKEYDDGTVYSCTGLGYKMYQYNRSSVDATVEFGPFFIKERTE